MYDEKLIPFILLEEVEGLKSPDLEKRKNLITKVLRPKIQEIVAPVLNCLEKAIGIDLFWYSKISVAPLLTEESELNYVAYGIEPRRNEGYTKNTPNLDIYLRFEIHSPEEIGTYFKISGKYEKSRFALVFHENTEELIRLILNSFVFGRIKEFNVPLTDIEKIVDFFDEYLTGEDLVVFFGPIDVFRPKDEIYANVLLRFLTLFPIYQGIIESALQKTSNFKTYERKVFEFITKK
jgi:hypothetical protein